MPILSTFIFKEKGKWNTIQAFTFLLILEETPAGAYIGFIQTNLSELAWLSGPMSGPPEVYLPKGLKVF